MTLKDQMLKARDLIRDKRYEEARAILEKIDHPKAHEWLEKINAVAPRTQTTRKKSTSKTTSASPNSPLLPVAVGLIALAVIAGIVLFVVVPALNDSTPPSTEIPAGDSQAAALVLPTDEAAAPTTVADTSANTSDSGDGPVTGSGLRLPFLSGDGLLTAELPQDWECDCAGTSPLLRLDFRNTINARLLSFAFNPDSYRDKPLGDALADDVNEDYTVSTPETLMAGGREVLFVTLTDEDGDSEQRYYVKDDDGYIVSLVLPSYVDDPAPLQKFVLFIAENIDAQGADAAREFTGQRQEDRIAFNAASNRWRLVDNLFTDLEHTLELPADWTLNCAGMIGLAMATKTDGTTTVATAIQAVPRGFVPSSDASVADILLSFAGGDRVDGQQTTTVNGREVSWANVTVPDGGTNATSVYYIVRDSDGNVVGFIIQPEVADKAALHEDVLFMAGSIETETIAYVEQLRRLGLIEGAPPSDDGFVIATDTGCIDIRDF